MRVLHIGWGASPWRNASITEYVEDLMETQVAHGYEVGYFFAGRHFPLLRKPRLRRWSRGTIVMYEIINSPIPFAPHLGTHTPLLELSEPNSEEFFQHALESFRPDIVHIQELSSLPTSIIEIIRARSISSVMTLHDYFLPCPTVKLFDYNEKVCLSRNVGEKCGACCVRAPRDSRHWAKATSAFYLQKAFRPALWNILRRARRSLGRALHRRNPDAADGSGPATLHSKGFMAEAYQRRRDVNIARLNMLDILVAESNRLKEIYGMLGVNPARIIAAHSTVRHMESLTPRRLEEMSHPIVFATLNGCASTEKGGRLVIEALRIIQKRGLAPRIKFDVLGGLDEKLKPELLAFSNVTYHGPYSPNDLNRLLGAVHVGVVPSAWEEAYGYVGVEFLRKGIPVIGNAMGGITDYTLDNITGWVNRSNTAEGLADIMNRIIDEPTCILRLNQSILANYSCFAKSMKAHFEELEELYRGAISSKQGQEPKP